MIPNNVSVVGINYKVVEKPYIEIDGSRDYQGACFYATTEIQLLNDLSDERKKQVFIHELTHAVFHEAGFEEQDEDMINRIGIVLHQVLKDNNIYFGE